VSLLEAIYTIFGDRRVSIGRELTKRYEEIIRGKVSQVLKQLEGRTFKGEACIVVEGYIPPKKVKRTYLKTEEK
ncbi:MAG: hypothetical protein GXO96_00135, partial [Nitrospirae bacterium]|nr:hypothetical protein [Candidatus Manganitrophaceae bacterium]